MKYALNEYQRSLIADALDIAYDSDYCSAIKDDPADSELAIITQLKELFKEPHPPKPLWRMEPFTDVDRANILDMMESEISDDVGTIAQEALDDITDMAELVSYADIDPRETAILLECLVEEHTCIEDYESGENPSHEQAAAFMRRMGLIDSDGKPTPLGIKYLTEYK